MRKPAILLVIIFLGLLGAMAAAPLLVQPPRLREHNTSGQFDANRAKARLAHVLDGERPHPANSPADDEVRARLVATLTTMGITPIVRDQLACNELYKGRGVSCARVRNVIAVLGPNTGKSLLINAHYDSVPVGPGASDDGIGVATMLEVAQILKSKRLERPIIFLFNEGEELGLLGARAFMSDPASRSVDSLVNLEARGVEGPVNMFETSRPNSAPVALFARTVDHPSANSLSTDVYRLMPNYTDVNSFSERGWLTLNLAPIGNEPRYHSPGDDVAALDPATLQHMGDQTLALAEGLSTGTPANAQGNRIFMDICGRALITMPLAIGVIVLAALLLAFAGLSLARGAATRGLIIVVGTLAGSAFLSLAALAMIGVARPGMFWRAHPVFTHLATYAGVLLVASSLIASLARGASVRELRSIFWLVFLGLGALIGFWAPGGIVFFLFPPLIVLIGVGLARWWKPAETIGSSFAILFLYLTWGAMLGLLQELLNAGPMWVFAPLGSLLLLPLLIEAKPLIERAKLAGSAAAGAILVLAFWAAAAAVPAYSADRQERFTLQHVTDAEQKKSWWSVMNDGAALPPSYKSGWKFGKLPLGESSTWNEPAPGIKNAKAPSVHLVSQVKHGSERTLLLQLSSNGNDEVELVAPSDAKIRSAGVEGFVRPIDQREKGKFYIGCYGRSCDGVLLELTTAKLDQVRFLVVGLREGLPSSAAPLLADRPRFARPQYHSDASLIFAHCSL